MVLDGDVRRVRFGIFRPSRVGFLFRRVEIDGIVGVAGTEQLAAILVADDDRRVVLDIVDRFAVAEGIADIASSFRVISVAGNEFLFSDELPKLDVAVVLFGVESDAECSCRHILRYSFSGRSGRIIFLGRSMPPAGI